MQNWQSKLSFPLSVKSHMAHDAITSHHSTNTKLLHNIINSRSLASQKSNIISTSCLNITQLLITFRSERFLKTIPCVYVRHTLHSWSCILLISCLLTTEFTLLCTLVLCYGCQELQNCTQYATFESSYHVSVYTLRTACFSMQTN